MADEKYIEIANRRIKSALKYLNLVKNMTGSRNYDVEAEDVEKITEALHNAVDEIQSAFDGRTKTKKEFKDVL